MKSILLVMMVVATGLLGGCSSPPVKIDLSTAEELPKEIALNYLIKIENEYRPHSAGRFDVCHFVNDGFYGRFVNHGRKGQIVKYNESYMRLNYHSMISSYEIILVPDGSSSLLNSCIVTKGYSKEEKPAKFFTKIPTALKSLGVKTEK